MKILFYTAYTELNINNILFEQFDTMLGDNLLSPFNKIAILAKEKGVDVGTNAVISIDEADAVVFVDYPHNGDTFFLNNIFDKNITCYLITIESPIIKKEIFDQSLHTPFKRIFTWSDKLVKSNPHKYIKINYAFDITSDFSFEERHKDFVIISGNKKSSEPNELYSERLMCINWFEKHAPDKLDLYGFNWDIIVFEASNRVGYVFNLLNEKFRLFKKSFKTYKGTVRRKHEVLPQYKFSICLENVEGYHGYITEKIFDCFFSGTIPIYKGAPNISDYIPDTCFINYDSFSSMSELYEYTQSISQNEIMEYQQNIKNFLEGHLIKQFSAERFASIIMNELIS